MVYGIYLRLPGKIIATQTGAATNTSEFVANLFKHMHALKHAPIRCQRNPQTFVFKDLATTPYVFVRHDAPRAALQSTYDSPFKILKRKERNFVVQWGDKEVNITLDGLTF
ncbi:hypothetical protein NQ314_018325 [Rhamnusium bicolor]|uniref:Uncharacterized protein n=1 Tax=Rhamnusium bicolor TaxID=1586634 RepID=A0AAV8WRG8_9CUCU|nr:hypothetical protein NQ314_018325 [Rhamnusium bicolor]